MKVLEGINVDVITPFPVIALATAAQWIHCVRTLAFGDDGPQTDQDVEAFLRLKLTTCRTYAIVDKDNLTATRSSPAPLVGIAIFEQETPYNGYIHVASNRRAWGEKYTKPGFMAQAGPLVLADIFSALPGLQRISVVTFARNSAAKSFARQLGFVREGYMPGMGRIKGEPADMVHYGLLRKQEQAVQELVAL